MKEKPTVRKKKKHKISLISLYRSLPYFIIENDVPSRTKTESCAKPRGASQKGFAAMAYGTHCPWRTGIQWDERQVHRGTQTSFSVRTHWIACVRRLKLDPALVSQPRVVAKAKLAKGVDCSLFRETLMDIRTLRDLNWPLSMKTYFANFLH